MNARGVGRGSGPSLLPNGEAAEDAVAPSPEANANTVLIATGCAIDCSSDYPQGANTGAAVKDRGSPSDQDVKIPGIAPGGQLAARYMD